jgi:hypothetical protein
LKLLKNSKTLLQCTDNALSKCSNFTPNRIQSIAARSPVVSKHGMTEKVNMLGSRLKAHGLQGVAYENSSSSPQKCRTRSFRLRI